MRPLLVLVVAFALAACGGGGGSSGAGPNNPTVGTTVTFAFTGNAPSAAALALGSGSFAPVSVTSNSLSFVVAAGTTTYSLAVACAPINAFGTITQQYVYQLSLTDGTSFTAAPCYSVNPTQSAATGSFDISAIAGATKAVIAGNAGLGTTVNATAGSFSASLPTGTNDIAVLAENSANTVLAAKIVRAQTVPGTINGGSPIIVTSADATVTTPVTMNGLPAGFSSPPALNVTFMTANGTRFVLANANGSSFPAVALADTQATDSYQVNTNSGLPPNFTQAAGTTLYTTTAASLSLTYPAAWSYAGPAAAAYPTFSFAYSGFNGLPDVVDVGAISWQPAANTTDYYADYASSAFLSGSTSIALPNLSGIAGFFGAPASGTHVSWYAAIEGGSYLAFRYPAPSPSSVSYVQNTGTYVEP